MKHIHIHTLLVLMILLTSGCASTKYFSIDVMQPAAVSFPENIVNLAIVDNAGAVIGDDKTQRYPEFEKIVDMQKEALKESLVQFMNEEKYFHNVSLYPTAIRTDRRYDIAQLMAKSELQNIAREMDADAIITIDAIDTRTSESMINTGESYYIATKGTTTILLGVYNKDGDMISSPMAVQDSVYWATDRETIYDTGALNELAVRLSEGINYLLIPHWAAQERWYYTDGTKQMKEADKQIKENRWAEAAKIWGAAFDQEQKSDKSKAKLASNIAVANEYLGDLENAVNWIRIASNLIAGDANSREGKQIIWYEIQLLAREKNNLKVLKQLGE